jgi:photosystem II oxygen-evolving enhancer protein 1
VVPIQVLGEGSVSLSGGKTYKLVDLCLEPKTWQVEEETTNKRGETNRQFVNTKLMTRQTYTLDGVSGDLKVREGETGIEVIPPRGRGNGVVTPLVGLARCR